MSRKSSEGSLFIGRLSKDTRTKDLEEVFETYGKMSRCEVKYGAEMAYGFVDFEDRRDAEDALRYENGRNICGVSVVVEWAKGNPRPPGSGGDRGGGRGYGRGRGGGGRGGGGFRSSRSDMECYKCHGFGHMARDCDNGDSGGYNDRRGGGDRGYNRDRSYRSRSR